MPRCHFCCPVQDGWGSGSLLPAPLSPQALRAAGWSVSMLDLAGVDHFDIIEKLSEENYVLTQVGEGLPSSRCSRHSRGGQLRSAVLRLPLRTGLWPWGWLSSPGMENWGRAPLTTRVLIPGDSEHDFKSLMARREQTDGTRSPAWQQQQPARTLPCSPVPASWVSAQGSAASGHPPCPSAPHSPQPGGWLGAGEHRLSQILTWAGVCRGVPARLECRGLAVLPGSGRPGDDVCSLSVL